MSGFMSILSSSDFGKGVSDAVSGAGDLVSQGMDAAGQGINDTWDSAKDLGNYYSTSQSTADEMFDQYYDDFAGSDGEGGISKDALNSSAFQKDMESLESFNRGEVLAGGIKEKAGDIMDGLKHFEEFKPQQNTAPAANARLISAGGGGQLGVGLRFEDLYGGI